MGAAIDTATLGPKIFTVTGADNAGNVAITNHSYTVAAPAPALGGMYWTDPGDDKIRRATLVGGSVTDLVSLPVGATQIPHGIALDVSAGFMYWTNSASNKIQRAPIGGGAATDILTGIGTPQGIALGP